MADRAVRIRVAILCRRDREVLLVEHQKRGRRYWLLPGGGVEPGETMAEAAAREALEETGHVVSVGRLLLICEAIEPLGRHIVNAVFSAEITGGALQLGDDRALHDVRWHPETALATLTMYPPVGDELLGCCAERGEGPVRVLGNVWRPIAPAAGTPPA